MAETPRDTDSERDALKRELAEARTTIARLIADVDARGSEALRWAAERIDPGPRPSQPDDADRFYAGVRARERGIATLLYMWASFIATGLLRPVPGSETGPLGHRFTPLSFSLAADPQNVTESDWCGYLDIGPAPDYELSVCFKLVAEHQTGTPPPLPPARLGRQVAENHSRRVGREP